MAKAQCARLMKFIIPSVTDSPTDSRNSSIPYAKPSNRTPKKGPSVTDRPHQSIVSEPAFYFLPAEPGSLTFSTLSNTTLRRSFADLLHLADIDGLHDIAGFGIDLDRAARAFPLQALGGVDEGLGVGLAAGLLQRLVDDVHAVVAADRAEVRIALELGVVGRHELLVQLGVVSCSRSARRVMMPSAASPMPFSDALVHRLRPCQ